MQQGVFYVPFCVMNIPEQVRSEARLLIEQYGESFGYLGNHGGADFFVFEFPEDSSTGFPYVYQYENGSVLTLTGFEALDIINLLVKDVDEVDVE